MRDKSHTHTTNGPGMLSTVPVAVIPSLSAVQAYSETCGTECAGARGGKQASVNKKFVTERKGEGREGVSRIITHMHLYSLHTYDTTTPSS